MDVITVLYPIVKKNIEYGLRVSFCYTNNNLKIKSKPVNHMVGTRDPEVSKTVKTEGFLSSSVVL